MARKRIRVTEKTGMSTGAKVAIVMVAGLAVGAGIYYFKPGGAGAEKIADLLPEKNPADEVKEEGKGGGKEPIPAGVFPLSRARKSKGPEVAALQKWLGFPAGTAPNFGPQTEEALLKKTGKKTMDESGYLFSVAKADPAAPGALPDVFDPKKAAVKIHMALTHRNADETVAALANIKNTVEYGAASDVFKKTTAPHSITGKTIVNAVLEQWPDKPDNKPARQRFAAEFLRMGLKYNGLKWSLGCLAPASRLMGI